MGNRLATIDICRKVEERCCAPFRGGGSCVGLTKSKSTATDEQDRQCSSSAYTDP